jgi:hypothetical protein
MYPHERELAKKMQNRPFAILGVNADEDRDTLRQVMQKNDLAWRAWWDGRGGPIGERYAVEYFPTIVLIDHKGRMRKRFEGAPGQAELDKAIETLVAEAEKDRGS